jgi:hypothetical protein
MRLLPSQLAQDVQPPATGHLLVQQHQVVRLATSQLQRVIAIRRRIDDVAALTQEK